jgi:hypothetical protein
MCMWKKNTQTCSAESCEGKRESRSAIESERSMEKRCDCESAWRRGVILMMLYQSYKVFTSHSKSSILHDLIITKILFHKLPYATTHHLIPKFPIPSAHDVPIFKAKQKLQHMQGSGILSNIRII